MKRPPQIPWSADEDSRLRALWAAGLSVNAIAAQIPGRNRNAVTGRALRLRLPRRLSPIPTKRRAQLVQRRNRDWRARAAIGADAAYAEEICRHV